MEAFEPKPLPAAAIESALKRATRYRILNEPAQAVSICRDILLTDPGEKRAKVTLLLALTDLFSRGDLKSEAEARALAAQLDSEYERCYYTGIVYERKGRALFRMERFHSGHDTYEYLRQAMDWFEKAEKAQSGDDYDPILRWNTCVRMIQEHSHVRPEPQGEAELPPMLE